MMELREIKILCRNALIIKLNILIWFYSKGSWGASLRQVMEYNFKINYAIVLSEGKIPPISAQE